MDLSIQNNLAKEFADGWKHFLGKIDFNNSFLDAEAIRFMNEIPGQVVTQLKNTAGLLSACEVAVLALTHEPINPDDIEFIKKAIAEATK